jgi:cyclic beta-1,2-glucan synthetase
VRENGGQYTHAALWVAMAFLRMGNSKRGFSILQMINPINRTTNPEDVQRYRVEPYVTVADIYALEGEEGRGGWSWYTGSASLMYRVILEELLGFKLRGDFLEIDPMIPEEWNGFRLTYRHGEATYCITLENPHHVTHGISRVELDQKELPEKRIPLVKDSQNHTVRIIMEKQ